MSYHQKPSNPQTRELILALVQAMLTAGCAVSVDNGGDEPEVKHSRDFEAIKAVMFATDTEALLFHDTNNGKPRTRVVDLVYEYGEQFGEVFADYSVSLEPEIEAVLIAKGYSL